MPVDPRMFAPADIVGSYHRGLQMHQQQQQAQGRKRLGDLLPDVMTPGGGIGGDNLPEAQARRDAAMREIAQIDPRLFMDLNEQQRKQAAAELDDVVGAVRWADTPEKWQQVQQRYSGHGDMSQYTFENREGYLLQLGKMGEFLKGAEGGQQPADIREYEYAKGQGFTGSFMDYKNQMGSPIMVDNGDGTKTLYPRSMLGGGGRSQQPAPPPPGFVIDGGPTAPQSGGFRP